VEGNKKILKNPIFVRRYHRFWSKNEPILSLKLKIQNCHRPRFWSKIPQK